MTTTPSDDELLGRFKQHLIDSPPPTHDVNNPIVEALLIISKELHELNRTLDRAFGISAGGPFKECLRCAGQGELAPGVPCSACDGAGKTTEPI